MTRTMTMTMLALVGLASCTQAQLASPGGQLFCKVNQAGGSEALVAVADAEATAKLGPVAGPVAVIATGAAAQTVQDDCARAAAAVGAVAGTPAPGPAVVPITPAG